MLAPGDRIQAGQLWSGTPAKFVRDLTEEEKEKNFLFAYKAGWFLENQMYDSCAMVDSDLLSDESSSDNQNLIKSDKDHFQNVSEIVIKGASNATAKAGDVAIKVVDATIQGASTASTKISESFHDASLKMAESIQDASSKAASHLKKKKDE